MSIDDAQLKAFKSRQQAGQELARHFKGVPLRQPLVLALPKGGVALAFEIAAAIKAPLEVLLVRKLFSLKKPGQHFGAMSECGTAVMNETAIQEMGLGMYEIDESLHEAAHTLQRRLMLYRPDHRLPNLAKRSVILVDDFADSGWSLRAAMARIRRESPSELILALAVAPQKTARDLEGRVDAMICLRRPEHLGKPEIWFGNSKRDSDEEVYLSLSRAAHAPG